MLSLQIWSRSSNPRPWLGRSGLLIKDKIDGSDVMQVFRISCALNRKKKNFDFSQSEDKTFSSRRIRSCLRPWRLKELQRVTL